MTTVTFTAPAAARSAAVKDMVSWVELWTVVGRGCPPKVAVELVTKPVPVTATLVAPAPAVTLAGERVATVGAGLSTATLLLEEAEVWPSGLATVMAKDPPAAASAAGTAALSTVALT